MNKIHRYWKNGRVVAETTDEEIEACQGVMMLPDYDEHEILPEVDSTITTIGYQHTRNICFLLWDMPDESRMRENRMYGLMRRGRSEDLSFTLHYSTQQINNKVRYSVKSQPMQK